MGQSSSTVRIDSQSDHDRAQPNPRRAKGHDTDEKANITPESPAGTPQHPPTHPTNSQADDDGTRPYQGKIYEVFPAAPPKPPENANVMPGGAANTAGGHLPEPTALDALKSIRLEEYKEFHKKPCVRDALLMGIGTGFAAGGTTAIFGKPVWKACNWAVGTFATSAFFMYQYCLIRRQIEKDGMRRVVEVRDRKRAEKEAKMQVAREARRKAKEEADRLEEERARAEAEKKKSSSWKFW